MRMSTRHFREVLMEIIWKSYLQIKKGLILTEQGGRIPESGMSNGSNPNQPRTQCGHRAFLSA